MPDNKTIPMRIHPSTDGITAIVAYDEAQRGIHLIDFHPAALSVDDVNNAFEGCRQNTEFNVLGTLTGLTSEQHTALIGSLWERTFPTLREARDAYREVLSSLRK